MFLALAGALLAPLFGTPLLTGRTYSQGDILFDHYPWAAHRPAGFVRPRSTLRGDVPQVFYPNLEFARAAWDEGRLPLWNPRVYGGQPFIGATQTAVFSPVIAATTFLPAADALTIIYLARLFLGGTGMFVLLGSLHISSGARLFGAIAWLLAPFTVAWVSHPVAEVAAWLPWLVWTTMRTCVRGGRRDIGLLAGGVALAAFAGHPETLLKALLLCGVVALACAGHRPVEEGPATAGPARRAGLTLVHAAAGVTLGLSIAAVQILPTWEYLYESRTLALRSASPHNIYVTPPETLATAVIPNFLGHPVAHTFLPMENRYGLLSNYFEQQAYPGTTVWLLAAVGVWRRRGARLTWALVLAAALAAMLMYGMPGLIDVAVRLPGFGVLILMRFGMVLTFCAVWLAAWGVDALLTAPARRDVIPAAAAAAAMAALVVFSIHYFWTPLIENGRLLATAGWTGFGLGCVAVVLLLVHRRGGGRVGAAAFCGGVTAVLIVELAAFAWNLHPTVDAAESFPTLPEIDRVLTDRDLFRVIGWDRALLPNAGSAYDLADPRGYDGIGPRDWGNLLDAAFTPWQFHKWDSAAGFALLDLLNVKYVFTPPGLALPADRFTPIAAGPAPLWRNERAFPRAFLVHQFVVPRNLADAQALIREARIDLRHTVLLNEPPPGFERGAVSGAWTSLPTGSARVRRYQDMLVEVETFAEGPAMLVLADNDFPGWRAAVDGQPASIQRADIALRGVIVPEGRHVVRFTYRPRSVIAGAAMTCASGVALLFLLAHRRRESA
jgi:hypothetical protein